MEFNEFLKRQGVKHIVSAPYHPTTNGLAERAVQVVKRGLRKESTGSLRDKLANVLFAYRLTAQSTTGQAPSELLLGRRPRSRLDLLKPNSAERVEQQQRKQIEQHNAHARDRSFSSGDRVFVKNYQRGDHWLPGVIHDKTGPVSFRVNMSDGRMRRCHLDQVRARTVEEPYRPETEEIPRTTESVPDVPLDSAPPLVAPSPNAVIK